MSVGLVWVLAEQFSNRWVSWYIAIGALPHLLLAPLSGKWIQRWNPLKTLIVTDAIRGIFFLGTVSAIPFFIESKPSPSILFFLFSLNFISNLAGAFFNPAILTIPIHLSKGKALQQLNALIDSCFSLGNVLGPLLSVAVYSLGGIPALLVVNALSFLLASVFSLLIQTPDSLRKNNSERSSSEANEKRKSFQPSWPLKILLLVFLGMNFVLAPLMLLMPWSSKNIFSGQISALATQETGFGIGSVLGSLILSLLMIPGTLHKKIPLTLSLLGLSYLGYAWVGTLPGGSLSLAFCILLFLGLFLSASNVYILTYFQEHPRPADVPLLMSWVNLISVASLPLSMGILGIWIEQIPIRPFAIGFALMVFILALTTFGVLNRIQKKAA